MTVSDVVRVVVELLERRGADYQIVGAIAYFLYGPIRFTQDVDFVVSVSGKELDGVLRELPAGFEIEPQARMELFTGTMRWVVGIPDSKLKLEFFLLGDDAHHREEFTRKKRRMLGEAGVEGWVATAEDLIVQKLRWHREKDVTDIRGILLLQADALDFSYIEQWCERHGTLERFHEIRRSVAEI